jgi:hypothetical protein
MAKSQTEAQAVLNTARGTAKAAWTPYLSLWVGDPRSGGTEVSGNAYARRQVSFGAPSGFSMSNDTAVTFPQPTGAWGGVGVPLTFAALMDAVTGGAVRHVYQLAGSDAERTVDASTPAPTLAIGSIVLTEN